MFLYFSCVVGTTMEKRVLPFSKRNAQHFLLGFNPPATHLPLTFTFCSSLPPPPLTSLLKCGYSWPTKTINYISPSQQPKALWGTK